MLMSGCDENKETINTVISKLYRKAEFDLTKAQRGIIVLDGMDKIGSNQNISEVARKQVGVFNRFHQTFAWVVNGYIFLKFTKTQKFPKAHLIYCVVRISRNCNCF